MLKAIVSYFFGEKDTHLSLDEAYTVLNNHIISEDDENKEKIKDTFKEVEHDFSTYHKTGYITSVEGNKLVIDNVHDFVSDNLNVSIGTRISYIAYINEGKFKISNVEVLDNDWDCSVEGISHKWCTRILACQVVHRNIREITVDPGSIKINLNEVASEFVPIVGDWLEVDAKCEIDENVADLNGNIVEINKLSPLRIKQVTGTIRRWDLITQMGVIDKIISFSKESLSEGYIPVVGDRVITEVIESNQGQYSWRSLKVVPEFKIARKDELIVTNAEDYIEFVEGLHITDAYVTSNTVNEVQSFTVEIHNNREEDLVLLEVKFSNANGQCSISNSSNIKKLKIAANSCLKIECYCKLRNYGHSRELLLFTFENFKVGRWVMIYLEMKASEQFKRGRYARQTHSRQLVQNNVLQGDFLKGQRPVLPPRFISNRLGEYKVPQKLWDIIMMYSDSFRDKMTLSEEIHKIKPCLNNLNINTYEDFFHTLLHIEEIANIIAVKNYDQSSVCFIQNGEYLMLEIENLSERRPSLMVGDKIIAKDPYNANSFELEGFIHKVGAKHVYLKFSQTFHDTYKGEDYSVTAVCSRTTYRRRHQAVSLAVRNLGKDILFPSKVQLKTPQFSFTYDEYQDELKSMREQPHASDAHILKKPENRNIHILARLQQHLHTNQVFKSTDCDQNVISVNNATKLLLSAENDTKSDKRLGKLYMTNRNGTNENKSTSNHKTIKLEWFNKSLNFYQKEAVRNILLGEARPLPYFIFGPPGTGKTITLIETILQLLRLMPESRILVGAPSNSAADVIALRLIESGIIKPGDLIRYVSYKCVLDNSIPPKLAPYCATGDLAKEGTRKQIHTVTENGLTLGVSSSVIGRHRVTVSTCSNLGLMYNMSFPRGHFTHIIVDEAGQLIEPDAMIPLAFLDVISGQAVLAGDPMQLGPVLLSSVAAENGLAESYLERMLVRFPYSRDITGFPETGGYDPRLVTRLVYNYRSLPEILSLSSDLFYNSELKPTISPIESVEALLLNRVRELLPHRENHTPSAMVFHGVNGENYQTPDSPSWFNPQEASQIFFYLNELYRIGVTSSDIGIISPYIKQIQQIRALITEAEFEMPKLGTVEEFQGQEFKIVLLSTVRSTECLIESDVSHCIGFISSPRRLNVALTRAQALLIIIGNPNILYKDPYWRSVLTYCIRNNAYCGCDLNMEL